MACPAGRRFRRGCKRPWSDKGIKVDMMNAGVSGDTTSGGRDRLDWSIPDGTEAVIVELGANDALRGLDPKVTRAGAGRHHQAAEGAQDRGAAVRHAGAAQFRPDYAANFNAIYPDLAKAYDVPLYPFFLDGVAGEAKLNQPDGIHPTAEGVDVIVEHILPTVEAFLGKVAGSAVEKRQRITLTTVFHEAFRSVARRASQSHISRVEISYR